MILESIHEQLSETLTSRALALFGQVVDRVVLQVPRERNIGDLATPIALELANALQREPREVAERLANGMHLPPLVESVSIGGAGSLEFRFDRGAFTAAHYRAVMAPRAPSGARVIVEHSSVPPMRAAHIGDLRDAVLGDTYARCARWLGDHVETHRYVDDAGVQVADVVVAFERLEKKTPADVAQLVETNARFDSLCGELGSTISQYYEDHPEALEWRKETLHRIESQEGDTAKLATLVTRAVVRRNLETMLRLGIRYDLLPKASDILHLHFRERAFALLEPKESNAPESEGAGTDVAYELWKLGLLGRSFEYRKFPFAYLLWETTHENDGDPSAPRFGDASRVVNVSDSGRPRIVNDAVRSIHFSCVTQAGVDTKADDLLDALEKKAPAPIAIAALRYFMLRHERTAVISFDLDDALRAGGDSGPYLRDATIRAQNLFREMAERGIEARLDDRSVDDLTLTQGLSDEMWDVVRLSAELPGEIRRAVDALDLSIVTRFVLDLCREFNRFCDRHPILDETDETERHRRAVCVEVFRRTMVGALDLLGIPVNGASPLSP